MAAILLDNIVIDLSDSSDHTNWRHDTAVVTHHGGDDNDLVINVGSDNVTIRAPLNVMLMIMDAIALETNHKALPAITKENPRDADCFDEYFDVNGNYIKKEHGGELRKNGLRKNSK